MHECVHSGMCIDECVHALMCISMHECMHACVCVHACIYLTDPVTGGAYTCRADQTPTRPSNNSLWPLPG